MYPNVIVELKRRGLSQRKLAQVIGMNEVELCRKLKGRTGFWLDEALKIADVLAPCSVEYLFEQKN